MAKTENDDGQDEIDLVTRERELTE